MAVSPLSRYAPTPTYLAQLADGSARPTIGLRPPPVSPAPGTAYQHLVVAGDSHESLAFKYLGSSDLWWQIADANPATSLFMLMPGTLIAIPIGGPAGQVERTRNF
jgi:hypothetical protein